MEINNVNLQNHLINLGILFVLNRNKEGKFTYKTTLETYLLTQLNELGIDYKNFSLEFSFLIENIEGYTSRNDDIKNIIY